MAHNRWLINAAFHLRNLTALIPLRAPALFMQLTQFSLFRFSHPSASPNSSHPSRRSLNPSTLNIFQVTLGHSSDLSTPRLPPQK